jgi:hypothetical protein
LWVVGCEADQLLRMVEGARAVAPVALHARERLQYRPVIGEAPVRLLERSDARAGSPYECNATPYT